MKNTEKVKIKYAVTKTNASVLFRKVLRGEISLNDYRKSEITFKTYYESREIQLVNNESSNNVNEKKVVSPLSAKIT